MFQKSPAWVDVCMQQGSCLWHGAWLVELGILPRAIGWRQHLPRLPRLPGWNCFGNSRLKLGCRCWDWNWGTEGFFVDTMRNLGAEASGKQNTFTNSEHLDNSCFVKQTPWLLFFCIRMSAKLKGIFMKGYPLWILNHRDPNHQLVICHLLTCWWKKDLHQ